MRLSRLVVTILSVAVLFATSAGPTAAQRRGGHRSNYSRSYRSSGHRTRSYSPRSSSHRYSYGTRSRSSGHRTGSYRPRTGHRSTLAAGGRDSRGRIKRSQSAKREFMARTGHPGGWKGHVVDHVVPLACGGADAPSNMQWQTTRDAKIKDKTERRGCRR